MALLYPVFLLAIKCFRRLFLGDIFAGQFCYVWVFYLRGPAEMARWQNAKMIFPKGYIFPGTMIVSQN
jgi:hypothetical protein